MAECQEYLVKITVNEPPKGSTLEFHSFIEDTAVFSVNNVSTILIFDNRPEVVADPENIKVFSGPALVSYFKTGGYIMIVIDPAPKGTKSKDIVHELWIAKDFPGHVGTRKFLIFEGGSDKRDAISFVSLYRFR